MEVDIPGCFNVNDETVHNFFAPILLEEEQIEEELWIFYKGNWLGIGNDSEKKDGVSFLPLEYLINYSVRKDKVGISRVILKFNAKNYDVDVSSLTSGLENEKKFYYRYSGEGSFKINKGVLAIIDRPTITVISPIGDPGYPGVHPSRAILINRALSPAGIVSSPYSEKEYLYQFGCIPFLYISYIPPVTIPSWGMFGYSLVGLLAGMSYNSIMGGAFNLDPRGLSISGDRTGISNGSDNPSANFSDFSVQSIWLSLGAYLFGPLVTHISRRNGFNFALRFIPDVGENLEAPAQIIERKYPERFRRVDLNYYLIFDRKNSRTYFGRFIIDYLQLAKEEEAFLSGKVVYSSIKLDEATKENALVLVTNNKGKILEKVEKRPLTLPIFDSTTYEVLSIFNNEVPMGIAVEEKKSFADYLEEPYLVLVTTVEKPPLDFAEPYYKRTFFLLVKSSDTYVKKSTLYSYLRSSGGLYRVRIFLVQPSKGNSASLIYEEERFLKGTIFPKFLASTKSENDYSFRLLFGDKIITYIRKGKDIYKTEKRLIAPISFVDSFEGLSYALEKAESLLSEKEGE